MNSATKFPAIQSTHCTTRTGLCVCPACRVDVAALPAPMALITRAAAALSYDVQEDDLARENRLSSKCWNCGIEKGCGHYSGCVAYSDPNANLSDEQLSAVQS